jgi:hypothetical protein
MWKDDRSPSCRYCAKVVSNVSRNIGRNTTHLTEYVKDWQWSMRSFLQFSGEPLLWQCPAGKPDTHSTNSQSSSSESCDLISLRLNYVWHNLKMLKPFPKNQMLQPRYTREVQRVGVATKIMRNLVCKYCWFYYNLHINSGIAMGINRLNQ